MSRLMIEPECVTAFKDYVTVIVHYVYWPVVIGKEPLQSLWERLRIVVASPQSLPSEKQERKMSCHKR